MFVYIMYTCDMTHMNSCIYVDIWIFSKCIAHERVMMEYITSDDRSTDRISSHVTTQIFHIVKFGQINICHCIDLSHPTPLHHTVWIVFFCKTPKGNLVTYLSTSTLYIVITIILYYLVKPIVNWPFKKEIVQWLQCTWWKIQLQVECKLASISCGYWSEHYILNC
jgi:hypothetical protein